MIDIRVHVFYADPDLGRDYRGQPYCVSCPLPKRHPVHDVPERPPEDESPRMVGEREERARVG